MYTIIRRTTDTQQGRNRGKIRVYTNMSRTVATEPLNE